jgi:hypothetical protein
MALSNEFCNFLIDEIVLQGTKNEYIDLNDIADA